MKKKKEKTEVQENEVPVVLFMNDMELLRVKLAQSEIELNLLKANTILRDKVDYLKKIDPESKLASYSQLSTQHMTEAANKQKVYEDLMSQIGTRLGVNMKECCWDDETGVVKIL